MSSELIKHICFLNDGVCFTSASSNIEPQEYYTEISSYHTALLLNHGLEPVIKSILFDFAGGEFKPVGNDPQVKLYAKIASSVKKTKAYQKLEQIYFDYKNQPPKERAETEQKMRALLYAGYIKQTI